ncbi:hypothetical protein G159_03155 [Planococcus glaciei CHR43]|nr:hypothetical protein G159_03155 [Planococcus glaciei CHR43]
MNENRGVAKRLLSCFLFYEQLWGGYEQLSWFNEQVRMKYERLQRIYEQAAHLCPSQRGIRPTSQINKKTAIPKGTAVISILI